MIRAARLFGAAEGLRQRMNVPVTVWWRRSRARLLEAAREMLEDDDCVHAQQDGRAMSLEQALAYALEESGNV
jgi:hypothetical protein